MGSWFLFYVRAPGRVDGFAFTPCLGAEPLKQGVGAPKNAFPLFARRLRRRAGEKKVGAQPQAPG